MKRVIAWVTLDQRDTKTLTMKEHSINLCFHVDVPEEEVGNAVEKFKESALRWQNLKQHNQNQS